MPKVSLGNWMVRKIDGSRFVVTLPAGMRVTGDELPVCDLLSAIAIHRSLAASRPLYRDAQESRRGR